jgi:tetratricopeptide (TPR) repeat protein
MKPGLLGVLHKKSVLRAVVLVAILCIVFLGFAVKRQLELNSQKNKANQLAQQQRKKLEKNASAAQKYYSQQIKDTKDPRLLAQYHADMAQNYEDLHQWDKAIGELKQSVAIYDKGYSYYAEIANDYAQLGDKQNALNYYSQAVESAKRAGNTVVDAAKYEAYINGLKQQLEEKPAPKPSQPRGIPG